MTRFLILRLRLALVVVGAAALMSGASAAEWSLVWSDEFAQADGSAPDSTKWVYDLGAKKWGNDELETYTDRRQNSRIEGGKLIIEVHKESFAGSDGIQSAYTSARLKTQGKAAWTFGRMEARLKLPRGPGIWPAFWMLGTNVTKVDWPACGEIDIMENIGREPFTIHGTIHGPGYSGGSGIGGAITNRAAVADDFHLFAVEWEPARIRWFLDDKLYFTTMPTNLPGGTHWVFNQGQFLILNVAVGGAWPGSPDALTSFPQRMEVDYVRVYARTNTPRASSQSKTYGDQPGSTLSKGVKEIPQPIKVGPLTDGETALANNISLAEMNPGTASLTRKEPYWADKSLKLNFSQPDQADENTLNQIVWHSVKGVDAKYPARFAGAHGKGLKKLNLVLTGEKDDD